MHLFSHRPPRSSLEVPRILRAQAPLRSVFTLTHDGIFISRPEGRDVFESTLDGGPCDGPPLPAAQRRSKPSISAGFSVYTQDSKTSHEPAPL